MLLIADTASVPLDRLRQDADRTRFPHGIALAIILWAIAVTLTWLWMVSYGFRTSPSSSGASCETWPKTSLQLSADGDTLLFFLHPRCPCSVASTHELSKLLRINRESAASHPTVLIVASYPTPGDQAWFDTQVIRQALKLPNARLILDPDGRETQKFGVTTSGTVMLFSPDGRMVFTGGVTSSRGHEGENHGSCTLLAAFRRESTGQCAEFPVFGCEVCNPDLSDVESNRADAPSSEIGKAE